MADKTSNQDSNLGDFISRIKSEGIDEASRKSEEIISQARDEAEKILDEARRKADSILAAAEEKAAVKNRRGVESLRLASRDSLITLRRSIEETFRSLLLKECRQVMTGKALEGLIGKVVEGWRKEGDESMGLEVVLSEKDLAALSDNFLKKLAREIELKSHRTLKGGFHAGIRGGDVYYDFSDEAVADLLFAHLAPELAAILDKTGRKENKQ